MGGWATECRISSRTSARQAAAAPNNRGESSMALDIETQDIIIDETTGLQNLQNPPPPAEVGDDVDPSVAPHATNTTLQYLLGLDSAGGLTSPEVAFQANFVHATASAG